MKQELKRWYTFNQQVVNDDCSADYAYDECEIGSVADSEIVPQPCDGLANSCQVNFDLQRSNDYLNA